MQRFFEIGMILTLIIMAVNVHIMNFYPIASEKTLQLNAQFPIVAQFSTAENPTPQDADYTSDQVKDMLDPNEPDFRGGSISGTTILPFIGSAVEGAEDLLQYATLMQNAYTAVLPLMGIPQTIVNVIGGILLPIQILTLIYLIVYGLTNLKKSIWFA